MMEVPAAGTLVTSTLRSHSVLNRPNGDCRDVAVCSVEDTTKSLLVTATGWENMALNWPTGERSWQWFVHVPVKVAVGGW